MSIFYDVETAYPNEDSASGEQVLQSAAALGPYLSLDVLSTMHNMREQISEVFDRRGDLVVGATGPRMFDDHAGIAFPSRTFQWTAFDRTGCNAIRTFLDARKGRLVPFWVPTCAWDLCLAGDIASSMSTLLLRRSGYVDYFWPQVSRRYIVIWAPGGGLLRKITSASAVDSATEQIDLDSVTGMGLSARTPISYLTLCRLAEDLTKINWFSTWGCETSFKFVELPLEVPA